MARSTMKIRRILPLAMCATAIVPGLARGQGEGKPQRSRTIKPAPKTAARAPAAAAKRSSPPPPPPDAVSRAWHTPTPGKTAPLDASGRPMLVLQALNTPDRVTLAASSDRGGFSAQDLDRAAHLLRDHSGNEHPVDPRVLDLVYRIAVRFSAHEIRVISGYRTPKNGSHSNHGRGRAVDFVVPGTSDEDVAKFAREQGFVGVGVYPTSGFIHLDVRERSFFWVDYSGPGKKNRTRGVLADLAARSDARALARGEHGVGPFAISSDVDAALAAGDGVGAAAPPGTDDDDNDVL